MPSSPSFGFQKHQRLLAAAQFDHVFKTASYKISHPTLLILATPNDTRIARLGVVVSKKTAKKSVDRNLIKRRYRESFRLNQHALEGLDIILLARQNTASQTGAAVVKDTVDGQLKKLVVAHEKNSD